MSDTFWNQLSRYCTELAPVVGPLVSIVGETSSAIERASSPEPQRKLLYADAVETPALPARKRRRSTTAKKTTRAATK